MEANTADLERGYTHISGRVLKHYESGKRPQAPYIILDRDSCIRHASDNITHLVDYTPAELVGNSFERFLSWEQYRAALRIIAQRADYGSLQSAESARLWYTRLEQQDLRMARRLFSPPGKVASVHAQIRDFMKSGKEQHPEPSQIRIQNKNGDTVILNDDFIVYRHPDGFYAGAFVTLKPAPKKSNWFASLKFWGAPDTIAIGDQYVVPVFSLKDKDSLRHTISELIKDVQQPANVNLVLDFSMIEDIDREQTAIMGGKEKSLEELAVRSILAATQERAKAGTLKLGNVPIGVEDIATEYFEKKMPGLCAALGYHPLSTASDTQEELTTHEALLSHIGTKMQVMEEKFRANTISEPSISPVPAHPTG